MVATRVFVYACETLLPVSVPVKSDLVSLLVLLVLFSLPFIFKKRHTQVVHGMLEERISRSSMRQDQEKNCEFEEERLACPEENCFVLWSSVSGMLLVGASVVTAQLVPDALRTASNPCLWWTADSWSNNL